MDVSLWQILTAIKDTTWGMAKNTSCQDVENGILHVEDQPGPIVAFVCLVLGDHIQLLPELLALC